MSEDDACPQCGATGYVNEYDSDDDVYVMVCDEDTTHRWYYTTDDEVWK